ncbi:MAG: riboflavin kinase, partial [Bacteroidota bacterium]
MMQVHREIPQLSSTIVTSGSFDGVHLGHQTILSRLTELKRQHTGCETVVITFHPHPRQVLKPDQKTLLLSTFSEKVKLLDAQGIDNLVVIPFTKEFSRTSSQAFIQNILIDSLDTQHLVIGYDHRFGHNREGGFDYLQAHQDEYPFRIEEIPRQEIDESGISSTKIREALANGQPEISNRYLGYTYSLTGKVVRGQQIGRTIGYPTANLEVLEENKL